MNKYRLKKSNLLSFLLEKNDVIIANIFIKIPTWFGSEVTIKAVDGNEYLLKNLGIFFWRKIVLYKNGLEYAHFTKRTCTYLDYKLEINFSGEIYINDEIMCSIKTSRENIVDLEVCWEMDKEDIEYIIAALIILSLK